MVVASAEMLDFWFFKEKKEDDSSWKRQDQTLRAANTKSPAQCLASITEPNCFSKWGWSQRMWELQQMGMVSGDVGAADGLSTAP